MLQVRPRNQIVLKDSFFFNDNEHTERYDSMRTHEMIHKISLCRCLAYRFLGIRLGFFNRVNTVTSHSSEDYDVMVDHSIMAGLEDCDCLPDAKILGALINPLLQCGSRMVEAGLCTKKQYNHGRVELLNRMERFYDRRSDTVLIAPPVKKYNKWDSENMANVVDSSHDLAVKEFEKFMGYNHPRHLPSMEPLEVLGAIDDQGNPKEPVYLFGPVVKKGMDLTSGHNHAKYISRDGHYDIVHFLTDHMKEFPALNSVGIGQLAPLISHEVDCESLFSQSGYLSDKRRANTGIRLYERLVVAKHRMGRIYLHLPDVQKKFMQRFRDNNWDEAEERDSTEFLELEKAIYLEMFPNNAGIFGGEEEEEDEKTESREEESSKDPIVVDGS